VVAPLVVSEDITSHSCFRLEKSGERSIASRGIHEDYL